MKTINDIKGFIRLYEDYLKDEKKKKGNLDNFIKWLKIQVVKFGFQDK